MCSSRRFESTYAARLEAWGDVRRTSNPSGSGYHGPIGDAFFPRRRSRRSGTHSLSRLPEISSMKYTKLGHTGLDVSRICLGCMTYGVPQRGTHPWTLDEDSSRPFIRAALELGIN